MSMKLTRADVTSGYGMRLTLEVREDLSDPEVGQILKTEYLSKVGIRLTPTIQSSDDEPGDGIRVVEIRFEMPARYDDMVNVLALVTLLSGKAVSSTRIDHDQISRDLKVAWEAVQPIVRERPEGGLTVDDTVEEADAALQKGLAFIGAPGAYRVVQNDGVPGWEFPHPGAVAHLSFLTPVRDVRRVIVQYLAGLGL